MKYWEAILREVLEKNDDSTQFFYTNLKKTNPTKKTSEIMENKVSKENKKYFIEDSKEVYFTQREAECVYLLMQGHTIMSAAACLDLSPRTVEFYVKNIKLKLCCKNKSALLKQIANSTFMKNYADKFKNID